MLSAAGGTSASSSQPASPPSDPLRARGQGAAGCKGVAASTLEHLGEMQRMHFNKMSLGRPHMDVRKDVLTGVLSEVRMEVLTDFLTDYAQTSLHTSVDIKFNECPLLFYFGGIPCLLHGE